MLTDFAAALSFILITIFTPGPNNVSSAAMAALYGYRRSLPYMLGIMLGFGTLMLVIAFVSASLLRVVPQLAAILRYVGSAYILYLAYHILKTSYRVQTENTRPLSFANGMVLQLLNPKGMVFSLTLFTSFFSPTDYTLPELVLAAIMLSSIAFVAVTSWAVFGTVISRVLHSRRAEQAVNVALALFLVYTALDLLGIL